ncbi:MAG: ABC transporter permease [Candidatus Thorarchaeota archaeon]
MTLTQSDTAVVMEKEKKPLHVLIVSNGAALLLTIVLLVIIDLFAGTLGGWIATAHASLSEELVEAFVIGVRLILFITLIISAWFGVLGEKLYVHRAGYIVQRVLYATICLLLMFTIGFGIGLIITFIVFFWAPKAMANWKNLWLTIYRSIFLAVVFVILILEARWLSELNIFLRTDYLLAPLSVQFAQGGLAWVSLISMFLVIPLALLLPNVILKLWDLRPNIESFWREFLYHPMGMIGLVIISGIILMAVCAPIIAPYHWGDGSLQIEDLLQPPSPEHILGTNHNGEDLFSRLIYGSQISLIVGFAASITAVIIGTSVGLISGYYGGYIDTILMRITDLFLCLPTLPLMLIFLVLFGQGLQNVIIVIAILGWTGTARMVRSEALSLRERPLTEAAHALGASDNYILFKHIMPNTLPLILANMILGVVNAILSEAGIAFLGFVDIHGQPSWGIILHWAWKNAVLLTNAWWWFVPPGLLIMLTTLGFVFVSHTADKVVNPRLRGRRG